MKWFNKCIKNYATFKGRARRKEYWMFCLFAFLFTFGAMLLLTLVGSMLSTGNDTIDLFFLPIALFYLFLMIPTISVTVRRLHDTGRSGFWWFISFIPYLGGLILTIFLVLDSNPNENDYGPNPKAIESN